LDSGNDGTTTFGTGIFSSNTVNFNQLNISGSLLNKYLVTWIPDSQSTDDSIYRIIGVDDAKTIRVDTSTGGTTRIGGKLSFSSRTNVHFRIVDIVRAAQAGDWGNVTQRQHLVLNFDAQNVNEDQLTSQVKIELSTLQRHVGITISPSGSWNGTTFTDGYLIPSQSWFQAAADGFGSFYFFGGRDFLITHHSGLEGSWTTNFKPVLYIEVPQRLYPKDKDPNPITAMMSFNSPTSSISATTGAYATSFKMVCHDGQMRDWLSMPKVPFGNGTEINQSITALSGGIWDSISNATNSTHKKAHFNQFSERYLTSDVILAQTGSTQYCMSRARLRRTRFIGRNTRMASRIGEKWLHIGGGILWPWDGSELPTGLFPNGRGGASSGGNEG